MPRLEFTPARLPDAPAGHAAAGLCSKLLLHNATWFTHIRWVVIGLLAAAGTAGLLASDALLATAGFQRPGLWLLTLAGVLVLLNLVSIRWCQGLKRSASRSWGAVSTNLWFQIVTDLLVLSVVVLQVGPTTSVVAFAYLFHITLACIFFDRRDSFLVTLMSILLFGSTVALTLLDGCPPSRLLVAANAHPPGLAASLLFVLPAMAVLLVVWHLVSKLSETVRQRDRALEAANRRILEADAEMNCQMLRVTHDLKAPFSGIESNIQILKTLHWDETPDSVRRVIDKIDARSAALRTRIRDILTLGSLRIPSPAGRSDRAVDLETVLQDIVRELQGLSGPRNVQVRLGDNASRSIENIAQYKILFSNLIANAVSYSRDGGVVEIDISGEPGATTCVRITDHGIGIGSEALPRIFEDFYRAPEAAAFNPESTGLGMAIAAQVARNLNLSITVESEVDLGTTVEVRIPAAVTPDPRSDDGENHVD